MLFEVLTASSLLFGAGLLPLVFYKGKEHSSHPSFQYVLSFAVGILLGDVFMHLLPEIWSAKSHFVIQPNPLVLLGIVLFFSLDRLLGDVVGYLTVLANTIDNFLHGLAIAIAFNVSPNTGWVTTAGILLHELPHEVTDYTVLAQSGFSKRGAAMSQLWTCSAGIIGSLFGVRYGDMPCCHRIALPLTSGIFLYVSLTSLIPSILKSSTSSTLLQLLVMCTGLLLTYLVVN